MPLYSLAAMMAWGQTIPVKVPAGTTTTIGKHVPTSTPQKFAVQASAGQTQAAVTDVIHPDIGADFNPQRGQSRRSLAGKAD